MRIGIILASSQAGKNEMLCRAVQKAAAGAETVSFGCRAGDSEQYTYVEIALLSGLLLSSNAVDFIVTGCSSGQGMMLACNSFPGVLCGYAPTPTDAYLFAQINNGNAVSLPLGEDYTWAGQDNLEQTVEKLFSEPFGQGYPKSEASRKRGDSILLKEIRAKSQKDVIAFLNSLDPALIRRILSKADVTAYILSRGTNEALVEWVRAAAGLLPPVNPDYPV